ncbi:MAG TPA: hypothetical protein V6C65_03145, partial [Allocoleopsis sp.]
MFNPFGENDRFHSRNIDADEVQRRYRFKLPHYVVLGLLATTAVRGYGYLFACHRLTFDPLFNGFWAFWLLMLLIPVGMAFFNKYQGAEIVQPWQITMIAGLATIAILACTGAALGARL